VLESNSGEDAVLMSRGFPGTIHLVVTDVIMPGMNGRVLAERLRQSWPDLKVLYISGYTENILDLYGPLGAATAFLQKPFAPAVLTQRLRELLDASK
jgi:CheY-like chemotaxis protein